MPGKTREQLQKEFDEGIQRLWIFYNREGYSLVNRNHKEDDGYFLGRFVKNSLSKFKNNYLSEENIKKLEEFPDWEWAPKGKRQNKKIMTLVETLKAFHTKHGHLRIPPQLEVDGENIYKLIVYYKGRYSTGRSKKKEIRSIESIPGWTWEKADNSYTLEEKWESKFQLLIKFAMIHGHTFVPQLFKLDGENLGQWTDRQRRQYENGDLFEHRQKRLESLTLWEWHKPDNEDFFNSALICLIEYFHNNGPKIPPKDYKTPHGTGLNEWIISQRARYKSGDLPKTKIRRLESIPGWAWSGKEQRWMKNFQSVQSFNDRFEHCEVPDTYKAKGIKLRIWLNKARRKYVKNQLLPDQREVLEKLKGWDSFMKKSLEYIGSLPLTPSDEAVFRELDIDPDQPLKALSEKTGFAIPTCSVCRKRYFQQKND
ncbi:MAG: helicase associated domain-containing protein [Lentisphaeraceae bacterium]|nr:helicase associated domain-containing protein [Lentisphaeraceae bacterium]